MMTLYRIVKLTCVLLAFTSIVMAGEEAPQVLRFRISMTTNITVEFDSKTQKIRNESAIEYTRERKGQTVQVLCDSISVKNFTDGALGCEAVMNRQKQLFIYSDGKKDEHLAENEPKVRKSLEAKFGTVLATIELNEDGSEAKRKLTVDPEAKQLIDGGTLSTCLLFHAALPSQKAGWSRKIDFEAPGGGSLTGELKYEKVTSPGDNSEADKQATVRVTGMLTADKIRNAAGNQMLKDVKMNIDGEQVYDRDLKEWISGTCHATITFPDNSRKCDEVFKLECLSKQNAAASPQLRK